MLPCLPKFCRWSVFVIFMTVTPMASAAALSPSASVPANGYTQQTLWD